MNTPPSWAHRACLPPCPSKLPSSLPLRTHTPTNANNSHNIKTPRSRDPGRAGYLSCAVVETLLQPHRTNAAIHFRHKNMLPSLPFPCNTQNRTRESVVYQEATHLSPIPPAPRACQSSPGVPITQLFDQISLGTLSGYPRCTLVL